jgi:hypothetical protein
MKKILCVAGLAALALAICQAPAFAQNSSDPNKNPAQFDFADTFYTDNGMVLNQINAPGDARQCVNVPQSNGNGGFNWVLDNTNTSPIHNTCRVNQVLAVFDRNGNVAFFNAMAVLANVNSFNLNDPNGVESHTQGDAFRAFFSVSQITSNGTFATTPCSPTTSSGPNCVTLTAAEGAQRQERVFDTNTTYFCRDIMNLWRITYIIFTAKAFTPEGRKILAPFAAANGTNRDGTPILNKTVDIDNLAAQGIIQEIQPNEDGSQGIAWIVCVVLADPTNGTITPDAFLITVNFANGKPVSPQFQTQFNCLQSTGQFCTP